VFNGNFSSYFNNNKLFRKFKMGYGAFYVIYVICPRASSQYVTPLNIAIIFEKEKLEWVSYPTVKN